MFRQWHHKTLLLSFTYKCEVTEDEANKATLIAAHGWNGQVQAFASEDIDPNRHDHEQGGHGGKLKIDVLDKAHHREWKDHGRSDLFRSVLSI